jgi:hypothetical protein
MKKRLTTFAFVIALMTGSVAELAILLYRGARMIAVSSLSLAAEIGSPRVAGARPASAGEKDVLLGCTESMSRQPESNPTDAATRC